MVNMDKTYVGGLNQQTTPTLGGGISDDEDESWTGRVGSAGLAKVVGLATAAGLMTVEPEVRGRGEAPGVRPEGSLPTWR